MNYTTAVFLINKHVRAVTACYEPDKPAELFKTLDPDIGVDDYVVVPTDTRHKFTICRVKTVNADVDFDSTMPVRWIVAKVDVSAHASILAQETAAIDTVKRAEFKKKRDDLKAAIFAADADGLAALELHANGDPPPVPGT
jgi:hypothetical protein